MPSKPEMQTDVVLFLHVDVFLIYTCTLFLVLYFYGMILLDNLLIRAILVIVLRASNKCWSTLEETEPSLCNRRKYTGCTNTANNVVSR